MEYEARAGVGSRRSHPSRRDERSQSGGWRRVELSSATRIIPPPHDLYAFTLRRFGD